jgi:UDP-2,3-diacylglucosamine pyrophosphatase LpxH
MRTVILSDLHLGSRNCHAGPLLEVLRREPFDRLVLNGDTVNSLNLRKFTREHWAVLELLRRLGRERELVLLRGNHDHDLPRNGNDFADIDVLPTLLGVPMHEEYRLEIGGRPYLVLHGDRFDPTLNYPVVTEVAEWCYQLSQKLNKKLAKWLKKKSKRWGGVLEWVRLQSVGYARKHGYGGVFTGHTHYADDTHFSETHYVNSGCWTEVPCAYVVVDSDRVALQHVHK